MAYGKGPTLALGIVRAMALSFSSSMRRVQMYMLPRYRFGLLVFASLLASAANAAHGEVFIAPYSGNLYVKCIGGSASATSEFGTGTSEATFKAYLSNLPLSCPTGEVPVGYVNAGDTIPFAIHTPWNGQDYWAFSTANDVGSLVAFEDVGLSLGMNGGVIQQTGTFTWLMHLNDAARYTVDYSEAQNLLIQIRIETNSVPTRVGPVFFPQSLSFTAFEGTNSLFQVLPITTAGLSPWSSTAAVRGSVCACVITLTPTDWTTPAKIRVSVDSSKLPPGTYEGDITVLGANNPVPVTVTVLAKDPNHLAVSVSSLTFTSPIGTAPPSQTIALSAAQPGVGLPFTATVSGGSWVSLSTSSSAQGSGSLSSTTPASITVSINPTGLALGNYNAMITVLASAASNPVQSIPVTLVVSPPPTPPSFSAAGIVNAASFVGGLVPGSLATVFGKGLSVVNGVGLAGGQTSLSGTSVTVGGTPSPLVSIVNQAGQEQISFQVPFELQGSTTTSVQVNNNGASSTVSGVPVLLAQPGIFAIPLSVSGTTAAVVHLNGQLVTPQNRAQAGEIVSLYLTGMGPLQPPVPTGALGPIPPPTTTLPAYVSVGGIGCDVLFSGYAPGNFGLYQINFQVPLNAPSGPSIPLLVSVSSFNSPQSSISIM